MASATSITIRDGELKVSLAQLGVSVADRDGMLRVIGGLMYASVVRTFRDEGSPAGSWPQLAESTKKKKGYTAGHKLLIMTGRLFNSITYWVGDGQLTVGTNLVYAGVHQHGSADRLGGSIGAQAKIPDRGVKVGAYDSLRVQTFRRHGTDQRVDKNGRTYKVRVREQGASNATRFGVRAHERHQNIPARPFLVFRPEDPGRFVQGLEAYLRGRAKAVAA